MIIDVEASDASDAIVADAGTDAEDGSDLVFADGDGDGDGGSDLDFADGDEDGEGGSAGPRQAAWKILLVDDEPEIHKVTKLALRHFSFEDRQLDFFHAYSGAEAREMIGQIPDIAVILLDVVMETDDAGLEVARHIREKLKNRMVRIILRTGQPGAAPEKDVIIGYEINEYKTKTELTSQKLFTTFIASLRNYRDLMTIDSHRVGLEKVIRSSGSLFQPHTVDRFAGTVLAQFESLLDRHCDGFFCGTPPFSQAPGLDGLLLLAGTGKYAGLCGGSASQALPDTVLADLADAVKGQGNLYLPGRCVINFHSEGGNCNLVYLDGFNILDLVEKRLLDVFCANTMIAIDNHALKREIEETQKEVVYRMGAIGETRSKETGNHVKRVAEYSKLLALKYGLSEREAELLRQASPMHDIGKVGIPDSVLNKPGKHTPEEWKIMQTHAQIGHDMLAGSNRPILRAAATVAREHHEKWDGSGYPRGLSGTDIHPFGRITALADVFDALGSDRCYKKAWPLPEILALLERESGKHFEPRLVSILLTDLDDFLAVRDQLVDIEGEREKG